MLFRSLGVFQEDLCNNRREAQVGVWGGAELGWGGGADLGVSRRICVNTAGRPKWGCGGEPSYGLGVFQEDLCKYRSASQHCAGN